jgi:hypothetical protein
LGITTLLRLGQTSPQIKVIMAIMGMMMFGNAGAMLLSAWLLPKKRMTFTDQVGFWDWATVLIDFTLVGILLGRWKFFTGRD